MATVPSTNCSRSSLAYRQYATMPLSASSMTHLKTSTGRRRPAAIKLILRAQLAAAGRLATSKLVVPLGGSGHTTCFALKLSLPSLRHNAAVGQQHDPSKTSNASACLGPPSAPSTTALHVPEQRTQIGTPCPSCAHVLLLQCVQVL